MTFSTRSNPKISASPVALTSLGAVGGARGTAAGALRVFVEFLTSYDRGAISSLENDLRQIDHAQNNATIAETKRQQRLTQVKNDLAEAERVVRGKLNTQLRADLKQIEVLEASRSKTNRANAVIDRQRFEAAAQSLGLTNTEIQLLRDRAALTKELGVLQDRQKTAEEAGLERSKKRAVVEGQIGKIQTARASLAPRLAGLAVGAIGGILGGAVLGVGFALADQAIQKIGDSIQDIIDPARHARDAIDELGKAVLDLAKAQNLTLEQAAEQQARSMGVGGNATITDTLKQIALEKAAADAVKDYATYVTAAAHGDSLREQSIKDLQKALIEEGNAENARAIETAKANGVDINRMSFLNALPMQIRTVNGHVVQLINGTDSLTLATEKYNEIVDQQNKLIEENAKARELQANATAFAKLQQEALNDAIQAAAAPGIAAIDKRLEALNDAGPSRRTQAIQAALDKAQNAGGRTNSELRNIDEEKALILFRQRLRLMGTAINLEKYTGKFLLEAINVKTDAINKEAAAQGRLNKLLDIQYQESQTIKRQAGETIQDFLERRAQENRKLLTERRDVAREEQLAQLDDLKQRVEDEVALEDLAERRREALRQTALDNHIKALQKQLEASQKADKKALDAKKAALEAEKKAIQTKVDEAIKLANTQAIGETLAAIKGAQNAEDIATLSGRIAGLKRAKATLEGMVAGFGIPGYIAQPFIAQIDQALSAYESREAYLNSSIINELQHGKRGGLAKGGVFLLNNASTPFGQNARVGEQGTELGVVLSNKVAQSLKQHNGGPQQVGPFNIGRSDDWRRDKYELRQVVEDAVASALRR